MKLKNMDKKTMAIFLLSVMLGSIFGYWAIGVFKQRDTNIFDKGVEAGKSIAIQYLFQTAGQCQVVPLQFNDEKMSIVAQHCIK